MAGYLFIAVYTDVNGYSGECLYYYLTFFINFICFLFSIISVMVLSRT